MATSIDAGAAPAAEAVVRPAYSRAYLGWLLGLLVAIYASSFLDRVIISTVGPAIIADLRISDTLFGLLTGPAFAIFYVVLGIPIARFAERSSRINIISICIALWSLMTALCGMASSYLPLLIFRMGVGVGEGGCSPAAHSLLSDHFAPRRRATALAIYFAGVPFGIMVGAILGGWLATAFNWRVAFLVLGLPGVLLALLAKLTLREPPRGHIDGAAPPADAPPLSAVIKRLGANPTVVLLVCGLVAANFGGSSMAAFTQTTALASVGFIFLGYLVVTFYFAPTFAVVQNLVEPRMRATASSLLFLAINMMGQALGPVAIGVISDVIARHSFTLGNYRALCPPHPHAPAQIVAACAKASSYGLQHSILIMCGCYLVGAAFYLLASRTLKRDLQLKDG